MRRSSRRPRRPSTCPSSTSSTRFEDGYLGGTDYAGTLANNGVLLAPFHDYDSEISAEVKAEIEALRAAIADGSVKVCTYLARGC